jgi:two-component system, LytTR family, response regulator
MNSLGDRNNLPDKVLLEEGDTCKLVSLNDVRLFETYGNYTKIWYPDGKMLIYKSLNYLENRLPPKQFFRANRQYIFNINSIVDLNYCKGSGYIVTICCGKEISISRRRSNRFREIFSI